MSGARKARKSVPLSETVAVNTREVNVAIEGLDPAGITRSFAVHLLKDGKRIASRFFFRPSEDAEATRSGGRSEIVHFDFLLPIDVVADGKLRVEIEPVEPVVPREPALSEQIGHPTLSVYLMLETP
jgi:tyrosinase